MNWLAHIFLSKPNIEFQLGNFLADPMKGKLWEGASQEFINGVKTHQKIDSYTDKHPLVHKSKFYVGEKGLLRGVVLDLTYDYFLTKNWDKFSKIPKEEFINTFYKNANKKALELPETPKNLILNLIKNDRLNKYNSLNELYIAFERIDKRLSKRVLKKESTINYFNNVENNIENLEELFLQFFPQLKSNIFNS